LAGHALERVKQLAFLGVGRGAQLIDGVADAPRLGLFTRRSAQRTLTEQRQRENSEGAESERTNQSAAFGGGPI
jgi:hypothetical protein